MFKITSLTFYLFLYIHCIACLWWYIIDFKETWVPPVNYIDVDVKIFNEDATITYQYAVSMYYAVLILGGNELGPT